MTDAAALGCVFPCTYMSVWLRGGGGTNWFKQKGANCRSGCLLWQRCCRINMNIHVCWCVHVCVCLPYLGYASCSWHARGCVFWQSRRRRRSKGRSGVCWGGRRTCGRYMTWPGGESGERLGISRETQQTTVVITALTHTHVCSGDYFEPATNCPISTVSL